MFFSEKRFNSILKCDNSITSYLSLTFFQLDVSLEGLADACIKLYDRSGKLVFLIATWQIDNYSFPTPETLQVIVPHVLLEEGTEYSILLDEGFVIGSAPCYLPSSAVDDPYLYRIGYSNSPSTYNLYESAPNPATHHCL